MDDKSTHVSGSRRLRMSVALLVASLATLAFAGSASAQATAPGLGTAGSFGILAGSTITNTLATTVCGDIGLSPGNAFPGQAGVTQTCGATFLATPQAAQAQLDAFGASGTGGAYGDLSAAAPSTIVVNPDLSLAGPLTPGIYDSTAQGGTGPFTVPVNGALTLNFQGDPNAVFIFRATSLTFFTNSQVTATNTGGGAAGCNVYFQLSDPTTGVTLQADSRFIGTTLSQGDSILQNGATVQGRILTDTDNQVTLIRNTITRTACFAAAPGGGGGGTPTTQPTPTPESTPPSEGTSPPADTTDTTPPATTPVAVAAPRLTREQWAARRAAARRRALRRDARRAALRRAAARRTAAARPPAPLSRRRSGGFTG